MSKYRLVFLFFLELEEEPCAALSLRTRDGAMRDLIEYSVDHSKLPTVM